ncbi:MAG TPA: cytidylate kinase family protein [Armatimonadota bacterium]|nr:cytidylate kinase family protein [Armatimonadota bacterium]
MKRIICISGDAASGKTTAAKRVLERLPGWKIVSTGALFRQYCAERGIDPQQISHLGDDLHRAADDRMREVLEKDRQVIAEARLVGYLARDMEDALRVFCDCPLEVRAARFQQREPGFTPEEALARVAERDRADTENLRHLWGIDYHDPAYYHLVLSTHELDPDQIADAILAAAGL